MASKRSLRRQLRTLAEREQQERRDLGVLVLEMYRRDDFDQESVARQGSGLAALEQEMIAIRRQLGEEAEPEVDVEVKRAVVIEKVETDPVPETRAGPPGATEEQPALQATPGAAGVEDLTAQVEEAEQRVREAAEGARRGAEEHAAAEIVALERDLEREQQRATVALEQLQRQIQETEERLSQVDSERERGAAEARAAAAAWLRGQARAMRREAERQVRDELSLGTPPPAPDGGGQERIASLEAAKSQAEEALAEMTRRSNEANARAQQAEAAAERERKEKSRILQAAEQRLGEIEAQAVAASERIDAAERQLAEEAERIRVEAEERIRSEIEAARNPTEPEMQGEKD